MSNNEITYIIDFNNQHSSIYVYDLNNRKYLDRIWFARDISAIFCMFDDPLKILGSIYKSEEKRFYYYIFDIESRTGELFVYSLDDRYFLIDYVALRNNMFLAINIHHQYENDIVLLDLNNGTITNIILPPHFPYSIGRLKEINSGKYSFITYGNGWQLLCITK